MRLANRAGRAQLVDEAGRAADLATASGGRFGPDPMAALAAFDAVRDWAAGARVAFAEPLPARALGPCVPRPRAVFAIGLNYRDHAAEAKLALPQAPMVFTKFPSCLAGPADDVELSSNRVDFEAELVVVIGRAARSVPEARALEHVAGYCVGQDVTDRRLQFQDKPPQFSLGKSLAGFGPIGPWLTTLEHVRDPLDLAIACWVDGKEVQASRTREMVFGVPELVSYLSSHCALEPGDLIFTGTPAGVGSVRQPPVYLAAGQLVETEIEGLGRLANRCVAKALVTTLRIDRLDDPRVAPYRDLREGRLLEEQGCFVAESRHVVRRLLASGRFPVRSLLVSDAALADLADALAPLAAPPPVLVAEHALLCAVAGYHVHQGCLALAERGPEPSLADVVLGAAGSRGLLVGLEQLTDPANVGSVFRNALAFGADAVLLAPGGAHPLFRKSVRVSMAATLAVPFARAEPWPDALGKLRAEGFLVLACVAQPGALDLRSFGGARPMPERVLLLFGTEGAGLTPAARAAADFEITVPTAPEVDSLNVATASGVVLHHFSRARRG